MTNDDGGYCDESDLLLGDLDLPSTVNPAQYIQSASDEIDARIGVIYSVPIEIDMNNPAVNYRATVSLLRSINARLASGRIIMSLAAALELSTVHAYARDLVKSATADIQMIVDRKYILEGATANGNPVQDYVASHVVGFNQDPVSAVDGFYAMVDPSYLIGKKPSFLRGTYQQ